MQNTCVHCGEVLVIPGEVYEALRTANDQHLDFANKAEKLIRENNCNNPLGTYLLKHAIALEGLQRQALRWKEWLDTIKPSTFSVPLVRRG